MILKYSIRAVLDRKVEPEAVYNFVTQKLFYPTVLCKAQKLNKWAKDAYTIYGAWAYPQYEDIIRVYFPRHALSRFVLPINVGGMRLQCISLIILKMDDDDERRPINYYNLKIEKCDYNILYDIQMLYNWTKFGRVVQLKKRSPVVRFNEQIVLDSLFKANYGWRHCHDCKIRLMDESTSSFFYSDYILRSPYHCVCDLYK